MKNALLSFAFLIFTLGIFAGPPTIAFTPQAVDVTGVWLATGVQTEPWTFSIKQDGTKLTGTLNRRGRAMGPLTIEEGTISGTSLSFKTTAPDARLIFTFTGTVAGNEITLAQSAQTIPNGNPVNTGLPGTSSSDRITIRRQVPATAAIASATPTTSMGLGVTGVWLATGVQWEPWTFNLKQEGTKLTGTVRQNGGNREPVDIEGAIDGNSILFKGSSPDGRSISVTGTIRGNEITLLRTPPATTTGMPPGTGLFGATAAPQITIRKSSPQ
jgi:hypothetical protein